MYEYYVYILQCNDGSFYMGVTSDLELRIWQHQSGVLADCYTYKRRPVELVYTAEFGDVYEAIAWERQVKRWSRKKKEALISGEFEKLPGLSKKDFSHKKRCHPECPEPERSEGDGCIEG